LNRRPGTPPLHVVADVPPLGSSPGGLGHKREATPLGLTHSVAGLDPTQANIARVYDYWLGGKDNLAVDRRVGNSIRRSAPWIIHGVRANRGFLSRAVTHLAERGIDQFLDVGSGLPTMNNVHEVAQRLNPACRVVYVDNDPLVLAHARALLAIGPGVYVAEGDLRKPVDLLSHPVVCEHLDWSRPIAVLLLSLLHFLTDADDPTGVVRTFRDALAPGSFLAVSHVTPGDKRAHPGMSRAVREYTRKVGAIVPRSPQEVAAILAGWEVLQPGLVDVESWPTAWRIHPDDAVPMVAGIARWDGPPWTVNRWTVHCE
jgi:trans-aconitate methyltransferase